MRHRDKRNAGPSAIVPYVPGEDAKDRHHRRLGENLDSEEAARERAAAIGFKLQVLNDGQHWVFRGGAFIAEWWPSSAQAGVQPAMEARDSRARLGTGFEGDRKEPMTSKGIQLSDPVLAVLADSTFDNGVLMLPPGQLERKLYEHVNKALEAMGGKWNRKARGHVFDGDASERLENAVMTGYVQDDKKTFQCFWTPEALAIRMVKEARLVDGDCVGEPSAGAGNILRELPINKNLMVVAIELHPGRARELRERFGRNKCWSILERDFLGYGIQQFDAIIMNPPFSGGQSIRHIQHALTLLNTRGRCVAICPDGTREREKLKPLAKTWEELPADTFKESGTSVRTVLATFQK